MKEGGQRPPSICRVRIVAEAVVSWVRNAADNLLPFSLNQHDLAVAIKEWRYSGHYEDLGEPAADCELCNHPDIRFQFEIINQHTRHSLLVGSECINKFAIAAVDEFGRTLDAKGSRKKVSRDRRTLIDEAQRRRVVAALVALSNVDEQFNILSFVEYFQSRGAFTPRQLAAVLWRLEKHRIQYRAGDFKLVIRRNREKDQLTDMAEWQVKKLWPCMTATQRSFYIENTGTDPS